MLKKYHPGFKLETALPPKVKPDINLPGDKDIASVMDAIKGTRLELPILMALWMGMRVSEIRGATFDCIKDHRLHVNKAIVEDENLKLVEKPTKTYSSNRWVNIPPYIEELMNALPDQHGHIVPLSSSAIRNAFYRLQKKHGLPHFTIHALRHANAAVMLKLGIPDKYAQERGGWATNNVLKAVYQYTMQEERDLADQAVNDYFNHKRK